MSDKIPQGYEARSAQKFNANFARNPPPNVIKAITSGDPQFAELVGLLEPAKSPAFALAVLSFQRRVFGDGLDADGKLGPKTLAALAKAVAPHGAADGPYLVHNGARQPLQALKRRGYEVGVDDADFVPLDVVGSYSIQASGAFYNRPARRVRRIVIHWGGRNVPHLAGFYRAQPTRSAHFGVDEAHGGRIAQLLDTGVDAWHAGRAGNTDTIGIDLCQFGDPARGRAAYPKLNAVLNAEAVAAGRGFNPIMELDSNLAAAGRDLVLALLEEFGLEPRPPRDASGKLTHRWEAAVNLDMKRDGYATVVGHHHLARGKSDVIGWWDTLFSGTPLA